MRALPNTRINFLEEVQLLENYISKKWISLVSLSSSIRFIAETARVHARFQFEPHRVAEHLRSLASERATLLTKQYCPDHPDNAHLFEVADAVTSTAYAMSYRVELLHEVSRNFDGPYYYPNICQKLLDSVLERNPVLAVSLPVGWNLSDKEPDIEEYVKQQENRDIQECPLLDTTGVMSLPLPVQLSLPHLRYSDKESGRTPLLTLISATYSHFFRMALHDNAEKLIIDLKALQWQLESPMIIWERPKVSAQSVTSVLYNASIFGDEVSSPQIREAAFNAELHWLHTQKTVELPTVEKDLALFIEDMLKETSTPEYIARMDTLRKAEIAYVKRLFTDLDKVSRNKT